MCQAYEAEYQGIVSSEKWASREGFIAAFRKRPLSDNPHHKGSYTFEAWELGWRCFGARTLPWSIESAVRYRNPDAPDWKDASREEFAQTGVLPEKVRNVLQLEDATFPS